MVAIAQVARIGVLFEPGENGRCVALKLFIIATSGEIGDHHSRLREIKVR